MKAAGDPARRRRSSFHLPIQQQPAIALRRPDRVRGRSRDPKLPSDLPAAVVNAGRVVPTPRSGHVQLLSGPTCDRSRHQGARSVWRTSQHGGAKAQSSNTRLLRPSWATTAPANTDHGHLLRRGPAQRFGGDCSATSGAGRVRLQGVGWGAMGWRSDCNGHHRSRGRFVTHL